MTKRELIEALALVGLKAHAQNAELVVPKGVGRFPREAGPLAYASSNPFASPETLRAAVQAVVGERAGVRPIDAPPVAFVITPPKDLTSDEREKVAAAARACFGGDPPAPIVVLPGPGWKFDGVVFQPPVQYEGRSPILDIADQLRREAIAARQRCPDGPNATLASDGPGGDMPVPDGVVDVEVPVKVDWAGALQAARKRAYDPTLTAAERKAAQQECEALHDQLYPRDSTYVIRGEEKRP